MSKIITRATAWELVYTLIAYREFESLSVRHIVTMKKIFHGKSPRNRDFLLSGRRNFRGQNRRYFSLDFNDLQDSNPQVGKS